MSSQVATISPEYVRLTTWALNRILAMEGSIPPELQLTDSLRREHEGLINKVNGGHGRPHLSRLSTSSMVTYETRGNNLSGSFRRVGISSRSRRSMTPISPSAGLGDASFWGVVIEEDDPPTPQRPKSEIILVERVFPAFPPLEGRFKELPPIPPPNSLEPSPACRPSCECSDHYPKQLRSPAELFADKLGAQIRHSDLLLGNVHGEREAEEVIRALAPQDPVVESEGQGAHEVIIFDDKKRAIQDQRLAAIVKRLTAVFSTEEQYKPFLKCRRSDRQIQALLDLFKMLLDTPTLEAKFRHNLIVATQRLAKTTGFYPICFSLQNVKLVVSYPLAGGSFANIYKGIFGGQHVCLKVIRLYQPSQVKYLLKRLYPEAILWGQLKHPNLLPFYGVYELGSQLCLVSPWAENGDINNFLEQNPLVNRVRLSLDVAHGVAYLHENGIIHGDLKGANILVHNSRRALLADFGLSAVTDPQILKWTSQSSAASKGGTIRWQAPELFGTESDEIVNNTKASDVYALACILYEIFTGAVPFVEFRQDCTVMHKVCLGKQPSRPAPSSSSWSDWGLTEPIWALMEDCWAANPAARPTIEQFIERLGREVTGIDERPASSDPISPPHFQQDACRQHLDYPTADELETSLWGTSTHVSDSE